MTDRALVERYERMLRETERDPRGRFLGGLAGLLAEAFAVSFEEAACWREEPTRLYLGGVVGVGGDLERAAVARFTEALAGHVARDDEAVAGAVYELCGLAAGAWLWPEAERDGAARDLAGWVA